MYLVILGAGVVGFQIAENLIGEGHDVVIIEKNPETGLLRYRRRQDRCSTSPF